MTKSFYSTPELAELLGVFHSTVRRWIERDQVKGFRVGRNYKIPAFEVKRMLDHHGLPTPEAIQSTSLNHKDQKSRHPLRSDGTFSFLKKLLIVEDIADPAVMFRRDIILGANKPFSDLVGCEQLDLVGEELNDVMESLNGSAVGQSHPSGTGASQRGPSERLARVKLAEGNHKACIVTVDEVAGLKEVFLAVVTDEI